MNIPERTIERLSIYYRHLYYLAQQGTFNISSRSLASIVGEKPETIRKDLSYFGSFGKTGSGYVVNDLKREIAKILGLEQGRRVAIVGMGNLGLALVGYKGFEMLGFKIAAVFDNSLNKIGKKYRGRLCHNIADFSRIARQEGIEMVILTVPTEAAQEITKLVTGSGIKALLNFAPVHLNVPKDVRVTNVDLATALKSLSFFVSRR
ncbi:redox-sensing transcriptional repressor Rex [candidate division WOR-1 bacterium RIFOXYB2_FULL_48_7]|uniref:Redox-sensing transcriptional repressor Rex n=1 Tax=candidate division WOR-1 bacterium RIFOXYB2_FULL_48_7 TaxID=1802583 RepID=A0A1F4TSH2_UNCSA|nr:MAG: redox-sensing transcriptional repressor Rex [candidate division WOR-1 bacterium RIFOXYB2_FULL_48_7]